MPDESPAPPAPRRPRRLLLRGFVLLLAAVLAGVELEAFARWFDPYGISYYRETNRYLVEAITLPPGAARPDGRIFENRPGAEVAFRNFDFRVNRAGLRSRSVDDGFVVPRATDGTGPHRILFLGDSVTLGWGVNDEDTWIRTVEREARAVDGRPLECLNAGHLQYNTIQEADWLAAHGPALRPDLVVLTYVVNDIDDAWGLYLAFRAEVEASQTRRRGPREAVSLWWRTHFYGTKGLFEFLRARWDVRRSAGAEPIPPERHPEYAAGWARSRTALERIRATCTELGADFLLLDHTTPRFADVRRWCEANDVPWYDMTFTPEEWERDIRNSVADSHANALGNRLLARKALRALVDAKHARLAPKGPR